MRYPTLRTLGVLVGAGAVALWGQLAPALATPSTSSSGHVVKNCASTPAPGFVRCFAQHRTDIKNRNTPATPHATPSGYGPSDLISAYSLPSGGAGATVAIIDAYDDPNAESDLATYRSQYGLPACTTANGCFRKVNQSGQSSPLPQADSGWAGEISLDLDMVSAICPSCHILLVEADQPSMQDLGTAVNTAVSMGAKYVSNSYGGGEDGSENSYDSQYFNHPGVAITASTGDNGYGASYPATGAHVTAVGGTSLTRSGTGWSESAWSGAGSGCSQDVAKPSFQNSVTTNCSRRAEGDVSAVADPQTGVAVYLTYGGSGWAVYGGTSASAPIIAAVYALAGTPGSSDYPNAYPYAHPGNLHDVTTGSNGSCGAPICTTGSGWDGPTGLGTPIGTAAFTPGGGSTGSVTVANPGNQTGTVGTAVSLQLSASGGTAPYTWTATGLPAGLSISNAGQISGTPTAAGTYSVTVTATDSAGQSGAATFTWTITTSGGGNCSGQKLTNPGFESGNTGWTASSGVITNSSSAPAHSGSYKAWLDGYGRTHTDTVSQTVTIPSGCSATLTFWLYVSTQESGSTPYDKLTVKANGTTLATYSNANHTSGYVQKTLTVSATGSVTITFTGKEDVSLATSFLIDDTALTLS